MYLENINMKINYGLANLVRTSMFIYTLFITADTVNELVIQTWQLIADIYRTWIMKSFIISTAHSLGIICTDCVYEYPYCLQ